MALEFLQGALEDLRALIAITNEDIKDIKEAKNDAIFERIPQKEELAASFVRKKEAYAKEIAKKLASEFPNKSLADLTYEDKQYILGEGASDYTAALHDHLVELKELNARFGKMSLAVGEFYSSLLRKLVPLEDRGYGGQIYAAIPHTRSRQASSSFLQAQV